MTEILSPAGDLERLKWALIYGADAVYIGGYNYSLRANANNFSIDDIKEYKVDVTVMGGDWAGSDKFEYLKDYCELVYLDRTEGISTSKIKKDLGLQEPINGMNQIPETK